MGARPGLRPCPPPSRSPSRSRSPPAVPEPRRPELRSARPAPPPPPWTGPPCRCGEWGRRAGGPGLGARGGMPRWVSRAGLTFPGTDGLARRWPEMPGCARRLDRPVGDRRPRGPCAQPSPAAPLLPYARAPRHAHPTPAPGELATQGLAGSWVPSPIPRASCVLGDPRPLPSTPEWLSFLPGSSCLPPAHLSPSPLLPLGAFFPQMKWGGASGTSLAWRGMTPSVLPPVRPPELGCGGLR